MDKNKKILASNKDSETQNILSSSNNYNKDTNKSKYNTDVMGKISSKGITLLQVAIQEGFKGNSRKGNEIIGTCLLCGKKDKRSIRSRRLFPRQSSTVLKKTKYVGSSF